MPSGRKSTLNLNGRTFGYLTVGPFAGRQGNNSKWACKCICGNEKIIQASNLIYGSTRSCGCKRAELSKNRKRPLPKGEGARRAVLAKYKRWAANRNLSWELSDETFTKLTQNNCFYCGSHPSRIRHGKSYGAFVWNGIDRVNNGLGYITDNCVSCCTECNLAKRTLTQSDFLNHIQKIAIHQNWLERVEGTNA